jgi:hypothetical protein
MAVDPRTDLSDLVRARRAELSLSLRKFVERCIDPEDPEGGPLWKIGPLSRLEKNLSIEAPTAPALRALAEGLRLAPGVVQAAAAAQFFGIDPVWSDDREVRALVHGYRAMAPDDQARVRELIRAWSRPPSQTNGP